MKTLTTNQALVLWNAERSSVQDLSTRAFAQRLCQRIQDGQDSLRIITTELSEELGISRPSVMKYLRILNESGEWDVEGRRGIDTTVTPNFLLEALREFSEIEN